MIRVHVVIDREWSNGMFVAASKIAAADNSQVMTCADFLAMPSLDGIDEVVVHGCWLPIYWKCCLKCLNYSILPTASRQSLTTKLIRMPHGSLDPVRVNFHGWKKRLVKPIEKWLFGKCDRVIVTGSWEQEWCEQWGVKGPFEITDLKRFFKGTVDSRQSIVVRDKRPLHVLYLGRRHPLKGVQYLERAVMELTQSFDHSEHSNIQTIDLRIVSNHFGEELDHDWEWCDVLCLPTLSDNFGLVVAEALERGKRVITTDGAPVWADEPRVVYLRGFREGTNEERVRLLVGALKNLTRRHRGHGGFEKGLCGDKGVVTL